MIFDRSPSSKNLNLAAVIATAAAILWLCASLTGCAGNNGMIVNGQQAKQGLGTTEKVLYSLGAAVVGGVVTSIAVGEVNRVLR